MSQDIEVGTQQRGDVTLVTIHGDLTAVTGERVESVYQELSSAGVQKLLLCFENDCYINSGGIAILIGMVAESMDRQQVIRIAGLSEHFQKIFAMVGLAKYAALFTAVEDALAGW